MALAIHLNSTTDVQHFTKFLLTGSSVIGHILTAMTGAILRVRFRYYGHSSLLASDWRPEVFSNFFRTGDQAVRTNGRFYCTGCQAVRTSGRFCRTGDQAVRTSGCIYRTGDQESRTSERFYRTGDPSRANGCNVFQNG